MGKYLIVLLGVAAMAGGIMTIRATWPLFWRALLAVVPALIVLVGMMAVLVGLGEIRDSLSKTEERKN